VFGRPTQLRSHVSMQPYWTSNPHSQGMPANTRLPCVCARCRQHPDGFVRQTRQLIRKHAQLYPVNTAGQVPYPTSGSSIQTEVVVQPSSPPTPFHANDAWESPQSSPVGPDPDSDSDVEDSKIAMRISWWSTYVRCWPSRGFW
jgi:hypothetical protein